MYVIVITGGIGAGKTVAAEHFRDRGAVVLDLDVIASHLLLPGSAVLDRVVGAFGRDVLAEDGTLDRAALARLAFASPTASQRLNAIVHPAVAREVLPNLTELQLLPFPPSVVVIDVPLLVEAPVYAEVADTVVMVTAPVETRIARATARGMSESDARARLACQASDEERAALADHIIVNDATMEEFLGELDRLWDEVVMRDGA